MKKRQFAFVTLKPRLLFITGSLDTRINWQNICRLILDNILCNFELILENKLFGFLSFKAKYDKVEYFSSKSHHILGKVPYP